MNKLENIISKFDIKGKTQEIKPLTGGLINSTYFVKTENDNPDYILQRKNNIIFPNVPEMMKNIEKVTEHIRKKVMVNGGDPNREVMTVIKTKAGELFTIDEEGNYWTMSLFIPDTLTYETADTPALAYKGGQGIGKFHQQLSDFSENLYPTIKGFHDLAFRFRQWDEAVKNDKAGRVKDLQAEIKWIEDRKKEMLDFWKLVEDGTIPKRVTHNDTKITNILFEPNGNLLCVIDLDTVMSNTLLADYGDAIRTFANTSTEDEQDLSKVDLDMDIFKAYTEGYMSEVKDIITESEADYLVFGARYIIFEQALRFLMDYIDGDTYYKIKYPGHNLVRTRTQQKLLERIEENYDTMTEYVSKLKK